MFNPKSRYYGIETAQHVDADGQVHVYVKRRFVPNTSSQPLLALHSVAGGDRLDNPTARYLGDPQAFWRVADSNDAMRPWDLTEEIGRVLRIVMPGA